MKPLLALGAWVLGAGLATAEPAITFAPDRIASGEATLLRIVPEPGQPAPVKLRIQMGDVPIPFWECPNRPAARCALVPLPLEAKPGKSEVLVGWEEKGVTKAKSFSFLVVKKKRPKHVLEVDPDRAHPSPEEQARAERERAAIRAIYDNPSPSPLWDGPMELPLKSTVTSVFGGQRLFNGDVKSAHMGVDLRAALKTPIASAAAGKVVYAEETFYGGNQVIVDHGCGVFSSYGHLQAIEAKTGTLIRRGDRIGLAGATGRVTGPHLHWGVRVNGIPVDPMQIMKTAERMWTDDRVGNK